MQQDLTQINPLETPCISSLCCRSNSEEDVYMNSIMSACRSSHVSWQAGRIEFKSSSSNTFPKDSSFLLLWFFLTVYLSYVASIYVMYLCSIFFQTICHENAPNKGYDAVQILHSGQASCSLEYKIQNPSVSFWTVVFHQRFGRLMGCLMIFARFRLWNTFYLTVLCWNKGVSQVTY